MKTITLTVTENKDESLQYNFSGEGFNKVEIMGILFDSIRVFEKSISATPQTPDDVIKAFTQ